MHHDPQHAPYSSLVHQLCGVPDLLTGLSLAALALTRLDPRLWAVQLLWSVVLLPLAWHQFRLRLVRAGVGYRPLPPARLYGPLLAGVAVLLVLATILVVRFHGPIPGPLQEAPLLTASFDALLALTGALTAYSLRWLRWYGYALVLLLGSATHFLGVHPAWPLLATGLLMTAGGLRSLRRFHRRHPQVLG